MRPSQTRRDLNCKLIVIGNQQHFGKYYLIIEPLTHPFLVPALRHIHDTPFGKTMETTFITAMANSGGEDDDDDGVDDTRHHL